MTHFFMKNRHFEWLSTFHKKWSCSSVSQFGAKKWASWLTFSWKIAILSDFQLFTKSGPAHQWANLEQRGEHHDSLFHEKSPFSSTFNFSQKVVLLISEPIWSKEVSIMTHLFMKNRHFHQLSTFHKKWSCSSVSQFGAKRWASWLTFSWKIAILSDFQLFTKSGPAHQWANLEQRGEHHDSLFHEKSPFSSTFKFSQKVVLFISEPIWSKEVSIMTHFFMKNRHFEWLSTFHKRWSCSSVSQFGAKRWASWLTFSWKIAIFINFQLFTKSGPVHQWANLEQRGEHHDSLFHEKSPFWVTFNFSQKVVLLISEPIWSKKWASWLTFSWKIAIFINFQLFTKSAPAHQWANLEQRSEHHDSLFHEKSPFWVTFNFSQKVVMLISEPIWSKEVSIMTHFFMKNRHFEWLSTFHKRWSCSSVSQFGAKRWASWLTFSWKIAIFINFQLFTKSGPVHQWANLEQRGEHHDSLFHEKSPFWVTFNFSQKVVLLISEPIWSKKWASWLTFSWKIAIFINFQLFTKSAPAHQWANLEQRSEHHDSLFHEKSPFWVTFNFSQKVVLLISEPIWSKEVSIMTHFFMKNRHFQQLSSFHKKWSCSSVSQFGAKRWASWLTFSWKIAILSDFQLFTKSGPAHQWANLEQEMSIMTNFFMKNRHFHQLSTFHKKCSCSSVSQFGAKKWASWLTFSWKIAILSDFQLFTKSGHAHQWANLEQRGEHHDSLFHEKSPFWVTFNFSQKVVLLISEPIWSKEVSIMTHFFMKNRHFHQLSSFHKKWSCSSVSQFGAKRWASWLTFSWKIAILSDFQLFTKSGPAHQWANLEQEMSIMTNFFMKNRHFHQLSTFHKKCSCSSVSQFGAKKWASWLTFSWKIAILSDFQLFTKSGHAHQWANLEQRGEHHDSLFHEKSPFWVTFNFSQKVVLLISEPIWSKEVSIMTHFFMKNRHFHQLSTFHKKWSCSSVSQFGVKRWASWLTFSWKIAIFINFHLFTKSGPAHQWANLE